MKRLSVALLSVALAAAAATSAAGVACAKQTNLTVWSIWNAGPGYSDDIVKLAERYQQLHPDVKINVVMVPDADVKLPVAIAGGVAPDVTFVNGGIIAARTGIPSYLQPLGPLMKADGVEDGYLPASLGGFAAWKGQVYAAPYSLDPNFAMFYNMDSFEEAGLNSSRPPESIEELMRYSEKLLKRRPDGSLAQVGMVPWRMYGVSTALRNWAMAFGAPGYADGIHYTLDTPQVRQALQFMMEYGDRNGGATRIEAFLKNVSMIDLSRVVMQPLVSTQAVMIPTEYPNMRVGLSYIPKASGGATPVWLGGQWLAIPQGATQVKEAWKFIRWVTLDLEAVRMTVATRFAGAKAAYDQQVYTPTSIASGLATGTRNAGQVGRIMAFYAKLAPLAMASYPPAVNYGDEVTAAVQQIVIERKGDPGAIMADLNRRLNAKIDLELAKTK